jgi:D-xylose transport system ATP-binding protein
LHNVDAVAPRALRSDPVVVKVDHGRPLLKLRGVSKNFGGVRALRDVDFHIAQCEVVAIVGDNGAGKSTLVKIIAGIHSSDGGEIHFAARRVSIRKPGDSAALGIATVYQDLALCDNLDVVANLYLGREDVSFGSRLNEDAMEFGAREVLHQLSVKIQDLRVPVGALSGGQRQAVAVARCVMADAKIVLLDEPTAALGVEQTANVLGLVGQLRARGLGVAIISHNLANVFAVADRIAVLRLGRKVADVRIADVTREQVLGLITGAISQLEGPDVGKPDLGEQQTRLNGQMP